MAFKLQYIDRVPQDGNYFSDYGTWAHQLLEQYAKDKIPSFALAEAYEKFAYAVPNLNKKKLKVLEFKTKLTNIVEKSTNIKQDLISLLKEF